MRARTAAMILAVLAIVGLAAISVATSEDPRRPTREYEPLSEAPPLPPPNESGSVRTGGDAGNSDRGDMVPAPKPSRPTHRLLATLTGFDSTLPGAARVTVAPVSVMGGEESGPIQGIANGTGRIDMDLSPLFVGAHEPTELDVRVDHPAYLPARCRISATGNRGQRIEIRMRRAAVLLGRVLSATGEPVAGATVSVHGIESGVPAENPGDVATSGEDGSYRLRAISGGERQLLVGWSEELAPSARSVATIRSFEVRMDDMILTQGASITGRTAAFDRPVAGVTVRLGPWPEAGMLTVGGLHLIWDGSGIRKATLAARSAADGSFRLAGLAEVDYEVVVEDVAGVHMSPAFARSTLRRIRPPAEQVDLDLTGARAEVHVQCGDRTVDQFALAMPESRLFVVRGKQSATLLLAPDEAQALTIFRTGYRQADVTIEPQARGGVDELTVSLTEEPPRPSLVVSLHPEDGAPAITGAGFGLFPAGEDPGPGPLPGWFRDCSARAGDGRFLLDNLPVGRYVLVVRPGTRWFDSRGHYLFAETEVDLREGERGEVVLEAKIGGRLRVAARDHEGRFRNACCRVFTDDGRAIEICFVAHDPSSCTFGTDGLVGSVPNQLDPPLRPGRYRLELEMEGYHSESVVVEVRTGRTAEVNVVLDRR